jgi:hypothetical protein
MPAPFRERLADRSPQCLHEAGASCRDEGDTAGLVRRGHGGTVAGAGMLRPRTFPG